MTKIIIAVLLTTLTMFSNCQKTPEPATQNLETSKSLSSKNQVMVNLGGLMVFHKEISKPGYEVGILPADSHGHKFTITAAGVDTTVPSGRSLTLEITNSQPNPVPVLPSQIGHGGQRRPDNVAGQFDFDWIVNLDGPEFHNRKLAVKPGFLTHIIHLPNARLFTKYKSMELMRFQGDGKSSTNAPLPFGYVPEIIAMMLELGPGQELVLKDDSSGAAAVLLKYVADSPQRDVSLLNARHPPSEDSDFGHYYELVTDVPKEQQYDFKPIKDGAPPYNLYPRTDEKFTCCMLICDAILLSKWDQPLP